MRTIHLNTKIGFGKYQLKTAQWVIKNDIAYMIWLVHKVGGVELGKSANNLFETYKDIYLEDKYYKKAGL